MSRAAAVLGFVVVLTMLLATSATGQVVPPSDPIIHQRPADPTNSQTATFKFVGDDGVTFQCKLDDEPDFTDCTSPKTYTELLAGIHTFEVKAVDPLDNANESGVTSWTWTIDLTPPNTTIDLSTAPDDPSSDPMPTFSFSSEPGATFECKIDTSAFGLCTSPYSPPGTLGDGSHTFVVKATDEAGNEDPTPASYTWAIDLDPPPVPDITDGPDDITLSASATFSFTSEADASFVCTLDGASSSCGSPKTYNGLSDGLHTLNVIAKDAAGNESLPAMRIWTVDLSPPHPTVTSPAAGSATADSTPPLLGTADAGPADDKVVTVDVYSGTGTSGSLLESLAPIVAGGGWSTTTSFPLPAGTYTAEVSQSDSFDRTGTSSPITFRVDTTAPIISLTRPRNGTLTKNSTPTYSGLAGTSEGDFPDATIEVHQGLSASGPLLYSIPATVAPDGTWSVTQPTPLVDGKYAALAKQSDDAGSTGTSPVHVFTLDTTAPSTATNVTVRAGYGAVAIGWRRGSDWKATDMLAIYRRVARTAADWRLRVKTTSSSWTDKRVQNGVTYQYDLVPLDRAGNRGPELTRKARPSGFRTPKNGATLSAPIGISWIHVSNSDYSNIQVWRVQSSLTPQKILSVWPKDNDYTLRSRWRYLGQEHRLRHGWTYRIYGWPGFGSIANAKYGKSYGWVQFTVR
jgi:Bacterial Ig-like domain